MELVLFIEKIWSTIFFLTCFEISFIFLLWSVVFRDLSSRHMMTSGEWFKRNIVSFIEKNHSQKLYINGSKTLHRLVIFLE